MPLFLYTVGSDEIYTNISTGHTYFLLIITVLNVLLPISVGMAIRAAIGELSERMVKGLEHTSKIQAITLLVWSTVFNYFVFIYQTWEVAVAVILLPLTGLGVTFVIAMMFRLSKPDSWTIAANCAILNAELVSLVLESAEVLEQPDKDIAKVPPRLLVTYMPGIMLLIKVIYFLVAHFCGYRVDTEEAEETARKRVPLIVRGIVRVDRAIRPERNEATRDESSRF